ncbi:hypothetical protein BK128_09635 [Viridibacillus sp. FSL H7-0596]|uniref:hypothetical protein n=1 Tax=Viridibacillus sp. FSL H7-0596 TaxID=1928923 RepID=UPI00096FE42D|nr:hypothetical protein [Viridibacillus sp. FSL H7-0596]OMC86917.1 hypothetical protein BK128_09635 [Viridibacillus sp. FSL H7-0596]
MNKRNILTFVLFVFVLVFVVLIYALTFQVIGNDSENKSTILSGIISGALGLFGGIFGALGAYFIAIEQIKKQDSNRVLDLKLQKYDDIISIFERLKVDLQRFVEILDKRMFYLELSKDSIYLEGMSPEDILRVFSYFDDESKYKASFLEENIEDLIKELQRYRLYFKLVFNKQKPLETLTMQMKEYSNEYKRMIIPDTPDILDGADYFEFITYRIAMLAELRNENIHQIMNCIDGTKNSFESEIERILYK